MDIEKYNGSGYFDPTAYVALKRIEKEKQRRNNYRPRVFICSPYRGDIEKNTKMALDFCRFAIKEGYSPFCPHLFFPLLLDEKDKNQRELGILMGMIFLDCCSQIWVFGDTVSEGMAKEIDRAKRYSKPIRFFTSDCKETDCGNTKLN